MHEGRVFSLQAVTDAAGRRSIQGNGERGRLDTQVKIRPQSHQTAVLRTEYLRVQTRGLNFRRQ